MKRIMSAMTLLTLVSSTFGCAVTRQHDPGLTGGAVGGATGGLIGYAVDGATGGLVGALGGIVIGAVAGDYFIGNWNEQDCLKRQAAMNDANAERAAWDAERKRLNDRIAELEAMPPQKEIVEVPTEVVKEVQLPGKEIKRYVISTDLLFAPGKDILTDAGKAKIDEAVQEIKLSYPEKRINIEGHTDTDPIVVSKWRSNWELGSARALAVLHYLEDQHGVEGRLMSATTFSYHQPVAGNDTSDGKQQNRRAAIVIYAEE